MRPGLKLMAISLAAVAAPLQAQVSPERLARPQFFNITGFGDFALVFGARSESDVAEERDYRIFEDENACYLVPARETYHFVINNRHPNPSFRNSTWATFVTVLYEGSPNGRFVSLYRNDGWSDADGRPLPAPFERNFVGNSLTADKFIQYHAWGDAQAEARARAAFGAIASQFHGRIVRTSIDSWRYFPNIASPIRTRNPNVAALGVSLHRYRVISDIPSSQFVAVEVPRFSSRRFTMIVETPGLGGRTRTFRRTFATSSNDCK
jgi:hypothetical protein